MSDKYTLIGKAPVPCGSIYEWGAWFEKADRKVACEERGDIKVSTVFLGLDHSFGGMVPLLLETMIFGGEHNDYQERCSTWEEAEEMHKRACELAWGIRDA